MTSSQPLVAPCPAVPQRTSIADLLIGLTAIAIFCGLWNHWFPPALADGAIDVLAMNLLLTAPIPAATIVVARRAGWLRGWLVSCGASTLAFAVYFVAFHGHRGAQAHPWLALIVAVWLGLNLGTLTWAVVGGSVCTLNWLRRAVGNVPCAERAP
jgi:hypothetical protein